MRFLSDNVAGVHPAVFEALAAANAPDAGYDHDALSRSLDARFSELFGAPVRAFWIATGTAANSLALASLCPPHGSIICHEHSHIQNDECGAPEFYTHGAKLLLAGGAGARLTPEAITARAASIPADVHWAQPHAVSLTNATEYGCVYSAAQTAAIAELCRSRGWGLHLDGARFANAVATLGVAPADLSWRAGVDILSFGFVKNGGMNAEALIFFRPDQAAIFGALRKRAGHLQSKGRFAAAQILALLKDDLWLANARAANAGAAALARAAGDRLVCPTQANEVFIKLSRTEAAALRAQGFAFYDWAPGEARLVVSWDQPQFEIAALAAALAALGPEAQAAPAA
jgi:threonine aldolase